MSYCCWSISTLHSYQPWSSERTLSIRREDLPCRLARPGTEKQSVSSGSHRKGWRMGGLNIKMEIKQIERGREDRKVWGGQQMKAEVKIHLEDFRFTYAKITEHSVMLLWIPEGKMSNHPTPPSVPRFKGQQNMTRTEKTELKKPKGRKSSQLFEGFGLLQCLQYLGDSKHSSTTVCF